MENEKLELEEGEIVLKYKIEIWRFHIIDTFKSNDINEILKWYREKYQYMYDMGECAFYVYIGNKELGFDEEEKLGFFKDYD